MAETASDAVAQGERALHRDGDLATARMWFDAAYDRAESAGDAPAMARAAIGLGGIWLQEHRPAAAAARVEARQRLGLERIDPRSSLAVRLRARLAAEADYRADRSGTITAVLADARRHGDPVALAECLSLAHHCRLGPDNHAVRLSLADELLQTASRTGRPSDLLMGLLRRACDLFLTADPHAERAFAELDGALTRTPHAAIAFVRDAIVVMRTIRAGRLTEAEELAVACATAGRRAGDVDADAWLSAHTITIRWYQGRIAELTDELARTVDSLLLNVTDHAQVAALATAAAYAGDRRLAESALGRLRGHHLSELPRSGTWLTTMNGVIEAANVLGDAPTAAEAYDLLRPFERTPMMASRAITCFGSVHHALGVASLTMGRATQAVDHFRSAVRHNTALGHLPAVALSRYRLGVALGGGAPPGPGAARAKWAAATAVADDLGMRLGPHSGDAVELALPPPPVVTCERRGHGWQLRLGPRMVRVADSVGMRYIAVLLANPGIEVPAVELATRSGRGGRASDTGDARPAASWSDQSVLDSAAVAAYRRRLAEIEGTVLAAVAETGVGSVLVAALRSEAAWLANELTAATGLGGRPRRFSDDEERARVAVGKAIRRALTNIEAADPALGAELRAGIQTGRRCCYHPAS
jgi:hypothetical protein